MQQFYIIQQQGRQPYLLEGEVPLSSHVEAFEKLLPQYKPMPDEFDPAYEETHAENQEITKHRLAILEAMPRSEDTKPYMGAFVQWLLDTGRGVQRKYSYNCYR